MPYRRYLGEWAAIFEYLARIASTEAGGNSFDSSAAPASMDALVKQCEAAGEAVKQAKAAGDAADIKAKVAALVKDQGRNHQRSGPDPRRTRWR